MSFCILIPGQYWGIFVRAINTLNHGVTIRVDEQGSGNARHVAGLIFRYNNSVQLMSYKKENTCHPPIQQLLI